ncbi:SRPBCC family protein [Microvirga tunisiensis]|uniref:SRPBCC family protein n=2 Tax=Microvirga tunisiensis TaxID=2108360 RepID=A0A5N7N5I9_9HYPH|nr:SRPBCC family protein [Microvirga tunisiensis]MPR30606.1 SRPBCC family protein [Microvirga tunisiensis]
MQTRCRQPSRSSLMPRRSRIQTTSPGIVGLALAAAAGVAAVGLIGAQMRHNGSRTSTDPNRRSAAGHEPEVERSITIEDVPADELYRRWRDPETMRRIMAPFADVQPTGDGQTRWSAGHNLGSWDMRLADDQPGEFMRWKAQGDGALIREASVRFRPATGNRGTVVVLRASLDPPGGMLGRIAIQMLGNTAPAALASKSLHFFKALVQTGEIPTTERQPAARTDPR